MAEQQVATRHRRPVRAGRRLWLLVASLLVTFVVVLVVALSLTDSVVRWVFIQRLQSEQPEVRRQGMVYVCRHADTDPVLRDRLSELYVSRDDPRLRAVIAESLRCAGVWGPDLGEAWLIQQAAFADDEHVNARAALANTLGRVAMRNHAVSDHPLARELIEKLADDKASVVRLLAMRAAVARADHAPDSSNESAAVSIISRLRDDADSIVAAEAWRLTALLALPASVEADAMLVAPEWVAQAMVYARPAVGRSLVGDDRTPQALSRFLPYALRESDAVDWSRWLAITPEILADESRLVTPWRALLAAPLTEVNQRRLIEVVRELAEYGASADPLAAAAISRVADHQPLLPWSGDDARFWRELAHLESLSPRSVAIAFDRAMPGLARVACVRAAREVHEVDLMAMFDTDEPAVRNLAVLAAYDRLSPDEQSALAQQLSYTYRDEHRIAGALLAGLIGDTDLLAQRLEREQAWHIRQYLRLAQMMAGVLPDLETTGLLARDDIDNATVVWAMMHAGRVEGLDVLLDPMTGSSSRLRFQLDQQRFWPILHRYLPAAPSFDLWADPALQVFQCDVIRSWYLVHRRHLVFDPATLQYQPRLP